MRINRRCIIYFYGKETALTYITHAHIPLIKKMYSYNPPRDMDKFVSEQPGSQLMDCCLLLKAEGKNEVGE